jgi:hypothetical protein
MALRRGEFSLVSPKGKTIMAGTKQTHLIFGERMRLACCRCRLGDDFNTSFLFGLMKNG